MNNEALEKVRAEFEKWISAPPLGRSLFRYPKTAPLPGQYRYYLTQMAWEAWQARDALQSQAAPAEWEPTVVGEPSRDLEGFVSEIITGALNGGNFDGADIQDMGVQYGLLLKVEVTEPCCEGCNCSIAEFPTECYRSTAPAALAKRGAQE